jgi:hypothetical protein
VNSIKNQYNWPKIVFQSIERLLISDHARANPFLHKIVKMGKTEIYKVNENDFFLPDYP